MQTTYNLVAEALQPILEWSKTVDFGAPMEGYTDGSGLRQRNIRLDIDCLANENQESSMGRLFTHIRDDIMDMVTNGDVLNHQDSLLNILDGEVKKGKYLSKINFSSAKIYREFKPQRGRFEYTLYLTIYTEFERS